MTPTKYEIYFTVGFKRRLKKISKKDLILKNLVKETIKSISEDPFQETLRTHQVNISKYGKVYSSSVNKDIRIIWNFQESDMTIHLLIIGGHSGSNKVYKDYLRISF
ncbi:MAG: hypothetical protein RBT33_02835 [Candidatus Dojkabacteria bacterium]|jgi:mRNA-degrading endonuclease YafQ of YafQ-DinJ toxin-antitoxin module|nr:hypothetical protein [Candidatus Dojkabacteria bacterium]